MKNCLIVVNTDKPKSELLGIETANFLKLRGVEYTFLDFNGSPLSSTSLTLKYPALPSL